MQLFLIRHAVAEERDPRRWPDDALRPLTAEGRRNFRAATKALRRALPRVDLLLSSGLTRADETARILTQEAHWPEAELFPALRPRRASAAALEAVRCRAASTMPAVSRIALVGHEPQISRLLSVALTRNAAIGCDFRKGAVAAIEFDGLPQAGRGRLQWFAPPAVVRALGRKRKS